MNKRTAIRLLKAAKRTLQMEPDNVGSPYICDNIRGAAYDRYRAHDQTHDTAEALCHEIKVRINGCFGVDSWLIDQGLIIRPDPWRHANLDEATFAQVQLYRQRWMDELIREFSA